MKGLISAVMALAILTLPALGFSEEPTPPPEEGGELKIEKWQSPVVQQSEDEVGSPTDDDEDSSPEE